PFVLGSASTLFHKYSSSASASQAVLTAPAEDLRALALEVARMGRDAHARAARLEIELRKLYDSRAARGVPTLPLDQEGWFQQNSRLMASVAVPDETTLQAELATLVANAEAAGVAAEHGASSS